MPITMQGNDARLALIERLEDALATLRNGCYDGACDMVKPSPGMHTNGGCRCWRNVAESLEGSFLILAEPMTKPFAPRRCW